MNSNSRYYQEDDCECRKEKEKEKRECKKKESEAKECPTIIKCSTPGSVTIPLATVIGTTFTTNALTLNTSNICNPCTKIEFTSNILATAFTGSITFQVFKQCTNQLTPIPVGPSFNFSRIVAVTENSTFSFFVCDCDSCFNGCCTYTVVITVNAVTVGVLTINNATLGAISTCQANSCNCCQVVMKVKMAETFF